MAEQATLHSHATEGLRPMDNAYWSRYSLKGLHPAEDLHWSRINGREGRSSREKPLVLTTSPTPVASLKGQGITCSDKWGAEVLGEAIGMGVKLSLQKGEERCFL